MMQVRPSDAVSPSRHQPMSKPLNNYLRTHRKLSGLTQTEVAYLLEAESAQTISRFEHGTQLPHLDQAFALETLFATPLDELFIGLHDDIERRTQNHAYLLTRMLADEPNDEIKVQKLRTLQQIYQPALETDP
jgi:DNA-binding XRE family transcriptional regulator